MSRSVADLLFTPRSIVVLGASSDPGKLSGRPLDYLKRLGFDGALYAVNPRRDVVQGVRAYPSVADVPGPVDLAIVVVPADKVPGAIEECAAAGVGAATVFASGFSEAPQGVGIEAQERLAAASWVPTAWAPSPCPRRRSRRSRPRSTRRASCPIPRSPSSRRAGRWGRSPTAR
jgi:acyl-CoA synthetase (NDP forming)